MLQKKEKMRKENNMFSQSRGQEEHDDLWYLPSAFSSVYIVAKTGLHAPSLEV